MRARKIQCKGSEGNEERKAEEGYRKQNIEKTMEGITCTKKGKGEWKKKKEKFSRNKFFIDLFFYIDKFTEF